MVKYRLAGIAGSSALTRLCSGMVRRLDHRLEFLARVEGHHAASGDRDLFPGFGIAARTLGLLAQLEIAETRKLHAVAGLERDADLFEESLHHILRFALVDPELLEQEIGQFRLGESHVVPTGAARR